MKQYCMIVLVLCSFLVMCGFANDFRFGQRVKVISGFYKGNIGMIVKKEINGKFIIEIKHTFLDNRTRIIEIIVFDNEIEKLKK